MKPAVSRRAVVLCLAALTSTLCGEAFAQPAGPVATIEGSWRLISPQSVFTPVGGGSPPFTAEGRKKFDANRAAAARGDYSYDPTRSMCGSPGQPRLMLSSEPFAIYVRPRMVTMIYKWNHVFRQVTIGEPLPNPVLGNNWWAFGTTQGHGVGRWEGGTLAIEADGFADGKLLDAFTVASSNLKLKERLQLKSPDILENRVTISDPDTYTRPWDTVLTYARVSTVNMPFEEDICFDRIKAGKPAFP